MKTGKMNLRSLFLVLLLSQISVFSFSQDTKLTRQEKKETRKARQVANFNMLDSLLNSRCFVLEADFLQNFYGERIPVVSTLNFIRLEGSKGVLQTGSNSGMGNNGVGGITTEGDIGYWKISKNPKNYSYNLQFNLHTTLGPFDVSIIVNADDNATATITGLSSGNLTWVGHLKTLNNSVVFKGSNVIY
jgi:hypothetical protein